MQEPEIDPTRGLEARYEVTKINDPEGKHKDCRVFVLDPQHDKNARKVLLEYAQLAAHDGQDQLAVDIIEWVGQIELREHHPRLAEELDAEVARREAEADQQIELGQITVHEDADAMFQHLEMKDFNCASCLQKGLNADGSCPNPECLSNQPVDGVSPDEAPKVSPAPEQAPRICPVHHQTDCSPLLNGCSELTRVVREQGDGSPIDGLLNHFGVEGDFMIEDRDPTATLREADPTFPGGKPMVIDSSGIYRDPENKGGYSTFIDPTDGKRI